MRGRLRQGEEGSISSSISLELSPNEGVPGVSGEDGTANASGIPSAALKNIAAVSLTPTVNNDHMLLVQFFFGFVSGRGCRNDRR